MLDIAFRDDDSQVRIDHAAENLSVLRHIALNLLKNEKTAKGGVRAKRLQAAWDEDYLLVRAQRLKRDHPRSRKGLLVTSLA
ncbi:MAG: hypothetical protein QGM50_05200 [Anaerolineae bacterium]|nr:hypothetical protein [Anaerolineae bacterium]MDK1081575.1 hypothetical protein [Anaerolineae bacterium]MDK1118173.1 hypothetical protein [Anaerolineae bacterium]